MFLQILVPKLPFSSFSILLVRLYLWESSCKCDKHCFVDKNNGICRLLSLKSLTSVFFSDNIVGQYFVPNWTKCSSFTFIRYRCLTCSINFLSSMLLCYQQIERLCYFHVKIFFNFVWCTMNLYLIGIFNKCFTACNISVVIK